MKHFIKPILSVAALLALSSQASLFAMFAPYAPDVLIEKSSLIVEGEYTGSTTVKRSDGTSVSVGTIRIDKTLKGAIATELVSVRILDSNTPVSGSYIRYEVGQKGLWLLYSKPDTDDSVYEADHPQRFVPSSDRATTEALLAILSED